LPSYLLACGKAKRFLVFSKCPLVPAFLTVFFLSSLLRVFFYFLSSFFIALLRSFVVCPLIFFVSSLLSLLFFLSFSFPLNL
jgi:hypothetical protein